MRNFKIYPYLLLALTLGCSKNPTVPPVPVPPLPAPLSVHLSLGNPTDAKTDVSTPDNYLMLKSQYALSYNNDKGTANWVSWELSTA